jgi:hypothetical protein
MTTDVLTDRALNRATLQRQLLLERASMSAIEAVDRLVGLQAQVPRDPYVALWSRLEHFTPAGIVDGMLQRDLVRIVVMRGTIHLVTADDALRIPPLMRPVLDMELQRHSEHKTILTDADLGPVLRFARKLLAQPQTGPRLRAALAERFGEENAAALAYACRNHLALVQVPPRGLWRQSRQVTLATAESWLGRPLETRPSLDALALRYLAVFGPASVADLAAWTRLTGLRAAVDRLRSQLREFKSESGRQLWDLPDAPRPDPEVEAPVRFLPEYDNVLLSHADRARFHDGSDIGRLWRRDGLGIGSVLHDGVVRAAWTFETDNRTPHVRVSHLPSLPKRARQAIEAEGRELLRFLSEDPDAADVRVAAVD